MLSTEIVTIEALGIKESNLERLFFPIAIIINDDRKEMVYSLCILNDRIILCCDSLLVISSLPKIGDIVNLRIYLDLCNKTNANKGYSAVLSDAINQLMFHTSCDVIDLAEPKALNKLQKLCHHNE